MKILMKKCLLQEKASAPDESLKKGKRLHQCRQCRCTEKRMLEKRRSRDKKYVIVILGTKNRMTFASDHTLHASLYLSNQL